MAEKGEGRSQPKLIKAWFSSYFENPWDTWNFKTLPTVLKMTWHRLTADESNIPDKKELDKTLPIMTYDNKIKEKLGVEFGDDSDSECTGVKLMWIGHASCLVKVDTVTFLTDPVFSKRCSPFSAVGPARYRDVPCTVDDLPHIDAVVISHNHYDHLDKASVRDIHKKYGNKVSWLVPKMMKSWIEKVCTGNENVIELSWWEEHKVKDVRFVLTPAQHWCGRNPTFDYNMVLWGSWSIIGPRNKFFFGGDTGYCEAFEEIGESFGPFDMSAIPIGAYHPRSALSNQHVDPEHAVKIHNDIKSKESVGIHWGTFKLTYEPYLEPKSLLQQIMANPVNSQNTFYTIAHGEIVESGKNRNSGDQMNQNCASNDCSKEHVESNVDTDGFVNI